MAKKDEMVKTESKLEINNQTQIQPKETIKTSI
jgi:hypothetical protein